MTDERQRPLKVSPAEWLLVAALALCVLPVLGCSEGGIGVDEYNQRREGERLMRNRVWDGYYTAAFNHRYCLRLAAKHPDEAESARRWRELQSEWRPLRYHAAPDERRVERLEQQQDRLEEAEDPTHYDDAMASEVQAELDRFLGAKR